MLQNLLKKQEGQKGFTIIEVLIVLAIAGLIIVVVLIAIPQLQRNQRNEQRRSITNRIKTEIDAYAGNNNGNYPAANAGTGATNFGTLTSNGFANRYLSGVNINDPQSGNPVNFNVTGTLPTTLVVGTVYYRTSALCNGELPTGSGSGRNYAVAIGLEGGAGYCVDNQ